MVVGAQTGSEKKEDQMKEQKDETTQTYPRWSLVSTALALIMLGHQIAHRARLNLLKSPPDIVYTRRHRDIRH
jgi:hypothetical protein